ncbi:hypothetical protein KF146HA_01666 [Lactococcus lactis]|nr:hypothetical protein [Lactococcus lactis]
MNISYNCKGLEQNIRYSKTVHIIHELFFIYSLSYGDVLGNLYVIKSQNSLR